MDSDIERCWRQRKEAFNERQANPPAARIAPKRPSPLQRDGRITPFVAKDGYINIFGLNPFNKEPADD